MIDIKEIEKNKNEFIHSLNTFIIESNTKMNSVKKEMNELSKQNAKNFKELQCLLS